MPEDRLTRGSAINGMLKFVKKKWGKEGLDACLHDIGIADNLNDGKYYPDAILGNILKWIRREKGMKYVREGGKFTVQHLGMLSWLLRLTDFKRVAESFPKNYSEAYKFGRAEVDTSTEGKVIIRLYDICVFEEAYPSWQGTIEGVLEATRTKGRVEITKNEEDGYCAFTVYLD